MNTMEVSDPRKEANKERDLPVGAVCSVQPAGSGGSTTAGL